MHAVCPILIDLSRAPRAASQAVSQRRFDDHGDHLACRERVRLVAEDGEEVAEDGAVTGNGYIWNERGSRRAGIELLYSQVSGAAPSNSLSMALRILCCMCASVSRSSGSHRTSSSLNPSSILRNGKRLIIVDCR